MNNNSLKISIYTYITFSVGWVDNLPSNTDNNGKLWHGWDVEVLGLAGQTTETDTVLFGLLVLTNVLFGTLEDLLSGLELLLLVQDDGTGSVSSELGILLSLLEESLWDLWQSLPERETPQKVALVYVHIHLYFVSHF